MGVDWKNDEDFGTGGGKYVYPPMVGEEATFEIREVRKVTDGNKRFHISRDETVTLEDGSEAKVKKNLGFHIECYLKNGKVLSITSLSPFIAFKRAEVEDGDIVFMGHPEKGKWIVEVVNRKEKK